MGRVTPVQLQQTEREFEAAVVELAKLNGWKVFHPFDSRRSEPGWPDLTLVRGQRLVVAELKSERGKLSAAQTDWTHALLFAGVDIRVWRPRDWPEIERTLAR